MKANIRYTRIIVHEEEVEVNSLEEAMDIATQHYEVLSNDDFKDRDDESALVTFPNDRECYPFSLEF